MYYPQCNVVLRLAIGVLLITSLGRVCASSDNARSKIAGRRALENEANWHVAIVHEKHLKCSGSLLRNNIVLTSAECIKDLDILDLKIRAGSKTFKRGGQLRAVAEKVYHPQYNPAEHSYNIGLLKLKRALNFTQDNVYTVRLPTAKRLELPTSVFVYGWGISSLNANKTLTRHLRVAKYRVYSEDICQSYLSAKDISNAENIFCVGDQGKDLEICNDDVGAPAVNKNGVQYGTISFGGKCSSQKTIIATNLVPHLSWIREKVNAWRGQNDIKTPVE
ncbi:mite allergen Der p 3-like [Stomoxys calcitrans]|uniref:mite allergen Der p 3-like n=1 Tax=Stomoxys calcitrans TaxID=35570 RepID=UPI0027E2204D|nr:mite allergen Der p 3-like [Stomoxys calcitrans]